MTDEVDTAGGHWSVGAGYLSSFVALDTGVGLQSCPWLVDVPAGRLVNITALSYGERTLVSAVAMSGCQWTVVVREGNLTTHLPGCASVGADDRQHRVLYTSRRRGVPISVYLRATVTSAAGNVPSHLLLYFQGSILSCAFSHI